MGKTKSNNEQAGQVLPILDGPDAGCYIRVPADGSTGTKAGHAYQLNEDGTGWNYVEEAPKLPGVA
jgi:hypothetical protein